MTFATFIEPNNLSSVININDPIHSSLAPDARPSSPLLESKIDCQYGSQFYSFYLKGRMVRLRRPLLSYTKLIRMAMEANNNHTLFLYQIYKWIMDNFSYYKYAPPGWKNSIRHALSTSKEFVRIPLNTIIGSNRKEGRSSEWCLRESARGREFLSEQSKIISSTKREIAPKRRIITPPPSIIKRVFVNWNEDMLTRKSNSNENINPPSPPSLNPSPSPILVSSSTAASNSAIISPYHHSHHMSGGVCECGGGNSNSSSWSNTPIPSRIGTPISSSYSASIIDDGLERMIDLCHGVIIGDIHQAINENDNINDLENISPLPKLYCEKEIIDI